MEQYSTFTDFNNYIIENQALVNFLNDNNSILDDCITPIIKALTFLMQNTIDKESEVSQENIELFEYGFKYLFENIEQLKLYLRQLNNDYDMLDKMSLYIKLVFNFEELRQEIEKIEDIALEDREIDLKKIDQALEYFEETIVPNAVVNEFELDKYINLYYDLMDQYPDIVLMNESFNEYCATYGI